MFRFADTNTNGLRYLRSSGRSFIAVKTVAFSGNGRATGLLAQTGQNALLNCVEQIYVACAPSVRCECQGEYDERARLTDRLSAQGSSNS